MFAVGAVMTVIHGTFLAKAQACFTGAGSVHIDTVLAQTALLAPFSHGKITLVAAKTMGSIAKSTVYAKLDSMGDRAVLIVVHAFVALAAFVAKMCNLAIAFVTAGAMGPLVYGTFKAKAQPVVGGARSVYIDTILAQAALLAPFSHSKIASLTVGAVGTLIISALQAHIVARFLVGAAVTDFRAGAVGTNAAFDAQLYAGITFVAFAAIGRAVNPILAIGAGMPCMNRNGERRNHAQ